MSRAALSMSHPVERSTKRPPDIVLCHPDVAVVFVIGADRFGIDKPGRTTFYVAATRAKLVLYITGVEQGKKLLAEAQAVGKRVEKEEV